MSDPATAVDAWLREHHADLLGDVQDCADAVVAGWSGATTSDRDRLVAPLRACLDRAGVLAALADLLPEMAGVLGESMAADPVPAPPYVVVAATGPVARATLEAGRLVVAIEAFAVERGGPDGPRYRRREATPAESLSVALS